MRIFKGTMETPRTEHGCGFYHRDTDGFVVQEANFNVFLDRIYAHRIAAGLFIGNGWKEECMNRSCEQSNIPCANVDAPAREVTIDDIRQFGAVASRYLESGGSKVPQDEAERRAAICVACPNNKPLAGICATCGAWAAWLLQLASRVSSSHDINLFNCSVCGCSNKLSIHLPLESQMDSRFSADAAPNECWKKSCFNSA